MIKAPTVLTLNKLSRIPEQSILMPLYPKPFYPHQTRTKDSLWVHTTQYTPLEMETFVLEYITNEYLLMFLQAPG